MTKPRGKRLAAVETVILLLIGGLGLYALLVGTLLEQKLKEQYPPRFELAQPEGGDHGGR